MTPTIVLVPGLGDSDAGHWQTLWQDKFKHVRVRQDDPEQPSTQGWSKKLQEVIEATPGDLVLVGHSCGVLTIVHWAQIFGQKYQAYSRVKGAFLVAPTDAEQPDLAQTHPAVQALAPVPMRRLPFPSAVVASSTDPFASTERAEAFARAWGAEYMNIGDAGHINVASGHGNWPMGAVLLRTFLQMCAEK